MNTNRFCVCPGITTRRDYNQTVCRNCNNPIFLAPLNDNIDRVRSPDEFGLDFNFDLINIRPRARSLDSGLLPVNNITQHFQRRNSDNSDNSDNSNNSGSSIYSGLNEDLLLDHEENLRLRMEDDENRANEGQRGPERGFQNVKIRPPRFGGKKSENVRQYFSKFEKYTAHQAIEEANLTDMLCLCLESDAVEYADSLLVSTPEIDYEGMKEALILRFDDQNIDMIIRAKLNKRKLKEEETVSEYYADLQKLVAKIEVSNNEFLWIFLNGLNTNMRNHIANQGVDNITDAFTAAKRFQQLNFWDQPEFSEKNEKNEKSEKSNSHSLVPNKEHEKMQETMEKLTDALTRMKMPNDLPCDANINFAMPQENGQKYQDNWNFSQNFPSQNFQNNWNTSRNFNQPSQNFQNNWNTPRNFNQPSQNFQNNWNNSRNFNQPSQNFRNNWNTPNFQNRQNSNRGNFSQPFRGSYRGGNNNDGNFRGQNARYNDNRSLQPRPQFSGSSYRGNYNSSNSTGRGGYTPRVQFRPSSTNMVSAEMNHQNVASLTNASFPGVEKKGLMTVEGRMEGIKVSLLCDTGSELNIASEKILQELPKNPKLGQSRFSAVVTVNLSEENILGTVCLFLELENFGGNVIFHVLSDSSIDLILGREFLHKFVDNIDIKNNRLIFADKSYATLNAITSRTPTSASAKIAKKTKFRPGAEKLVGIYPGNSILSRKLVFGISTEMQRKEFTASAQEVSGYEGTVFVAIKNNNTVPQTISTGKKIGTLTMPNKASECMVIQYECNDNTTGETPTCDVINTTHDEAENVTRENPRCQMTTVDTAEAEIGEDLFSGVNIDVDGEIKHNLPKLANTDVVEKLQMMLSKHRNCFAKDMSELGEAKSFELQLRLKDDTPFTAPYYRLSPPQQEAMDKQIEDFLKIGIIEEARAGNYSSPAFMIPKKKKGTWRCVVDFRVLNKRLIKDDFPVPRMEDIFNELGGAKYFSIIDTLNGFYQLRIADSCRKYTAFKTRDAIWAFQRMPQGICLGPSAFIRLMTKVLSGLLFKGIMCYLDDIICYSNTTEEHFCLLEQVFDRLEQEGIRLSPAKCEYFSQEIEILGFLVSPRGRGLVNKKYEAVKGYPAPSSKKEVKQWLGFSGFYRGLIKDYATIAAPLTNLLRKSVKFEWTPECIQSFNNLKEKLISRPVIAFPDWKLDFKVGSDASAYGCGGVLSQIQEGSERVIFYFSKTFNPQQKNYCCWEREALSVVLTVKRFEHFLIGRSFEIIVDNTAITYLFSLKTPTGRMARWIYYLQGFDFKISYLPGSKHLNCDALSRVTEKNEPSITGGNSVTQTRMDTLHYEVTSGHPQLTQTNRVDTLDSDGVETPAGSENNVVTWEPFELPDKQRQDDFFGPIIVWLETNDDTLKPPRARSFCDKFLLGEKGLLLFLVNDDVDPIRTCVPKIFVQDILSLNHDTPTGGHLGRDITYKKISAKFWWRNLYEDVKNYVASCSLCARKKLMKSIPPVAMIPVQARAPFETVQCDFVGPLKESRKGNIHLLVFTDIFTKWVCAAPLPAVSAISVAEELFRLIISVFGMIRTLQSDRGSSFIGKVMTEICKILGIKKIHSSSFRPCCNGVVEASNGSVTKIISRLIDDHDDRWDEFVDSALFAYRTSVHSTTQETPFFTLFGRRAILPAEINYTIPQTILKEDERQVIRDTHDRIQLVQSEVKVNIEERQAYYKEKFDENSRERELEIGDEVYLKVGKKNKKQV